MEEWASFDSSLPSLVNVIDWSDQDHHHHQHHHHILHSHNNHFNHGHHHSDDNDGGDEEVSDLEDGEEIYWLCEQLLEEVVRRDSLAEEREEGDEEVYWSCEEGDVVFRRYSNAAREKIEGAEEKEEEEEEEAGPGVSADIKSPPEHSDCMCCCRRCRRRFLFSTPTVTVCGAPSVYTDVSVEETAGPTDNQVSGDDGDCEHDRLGGLCVRGDRHSPADTDTTCSRSRQSCGSVAAVSVCVAAAADDDDDDDDGDDDACVVSGVQASGAAVDSIRFVVCSDFGDNNGGIHSADAKVPELHMAGNPNLCPAVAHDVTDPGRMWCGDPDTPVVDSAVVGDPSGRDGAGVCPTRDWDSSDGASRVISSSRGVGAVTEPVGEGTVLSHGSVRHSRDRVVQQLPARRLRLKPLHAVDIVSGDGFGDSWRRDASKGRPCWKPMAPNSWAGFADLEEEPEEENEAGGNGHFDLNLMTGRGRVLTEGDVVTVSGRAVDAAAAGDGGGRSGCDGVVQEGDSLVGEDDRWSSDSLGEDSASSDESSCCDPLVRPTVQVEDISCEVVEELEVADSLGEDSVDNVEVAEELEVEENDDNGEVVGEEHATDSLGEDSVDDSIDNGEIVEELEVEDGDDNGEVVGEEHATDSLGEDSVDDSIDNGEIVEELEVEDGDDNGEVVEEEHATDSLGEDSDTNVEVVEELEVADIDDNAEVVEELEVADSDDDGKVVGEEHATDSLDEDSDDSGEVVEEVKVEDSLDEDSDDNGEVVGGDHATDSLGEGSEDSASVREGSAYAGRADVTGDGELLVRDADVTGDGELLVRGADVTGDGELLVRGADVTGDGELLVRDADVTGDGELLVTDSGVAGAENSLTLGADAIRSGDLLAGGVDNIGGVARTRRPLHSTAGDAALPDSQAKLRASLSWLLSKVYGSEVPRELSDPFYENTHGQLVLRPVMVNILASSELYCQACGNMFPETHTQWKGHWSIIQVLSRKGIYIADVQDTAVTETVLVQTAPFRLKAHLALIDALMKAYACEVASVEAVVKAVRKMTTFPASSELPSNPEESLKFWINKVCAKLSDNRGQQPSEGEVTTHKDHDTSRAPQPSNLPVQLPAMEDVMRDVGDGCNVAAMIAYYKPQHLNLADVCLKESIGIADSLHNLRLIGQYCKSHLPWKCFHLSYEDLLYTHEIMKVNIIAFLTDFFYCFEGPGAAIMNGNVRQAALEAIEAMPAAGKRSGLSTIPSVPISSATKKSFQRLPFEDTSVNLGMGRSNLSSPSSHQPLLPRRGIGRYSNGQETDELGTSPPTRRGRRVQSLSCSQDRDLIQRSVIAWNDDQKIQNRSDSRRWPQDSSNSPMLSRVSIDSDMAHSLDASLSLDLAELETPRTQRGTAALDPRHPDYMEVESLASGQASHTPTSQRTPHASNERSSTQRTPSGQQEPLMPAVLKPTKERETSLTKAQERGDRTPRRKKTSSSEPQTPSPLATPQQPLPHQMSSAEHAMTSSADDLAFSLSTSSDETTVSSLPPGESQSPRYVHQGPAPMSAPSISSAPPTSVPPTSEQIGAFSPAPSSLTPPNSSRSEVAASIAGSYTVEDRASTAQAARAAGIPVVTDSGDLLNQSKSREGSVCSSGEYSDHESQKIHQDHKVRESGLVSSGNAAPPPGSTAYGKPTMVINDQLTSSGGDDAYLSRLTKSPSGMTTNFAELKRLKDELGRNMDKVDNSALIYMQSGSHGGPQNNVSPGGSKSAFLLKQGQGQQQGQGDAGKTPGPVYNDGSPVADKNCASEAAAAEDDFGGSSDLQQLRLKLEQKRKEIERKKHRQEAQQNKMRQRLGKAAFMRVVSKHLNGGENADDVGSFPNSAVRPEISANSTQAQLQARLGHPGHRLPLNSLPRGQGSSMARPAPQTLLAQVQNTSAAIHPDASANRFTDWRTQSQLSKGGVASAGGGVGGPGLVAHRPGHLGELQQQQQQQQQQHVLLPGHGGGGSANQSDAGSDSSSSASSHKSGNKAFSRESIQQTIDNVKNHWFRNSNDLISGGGVCSEEEMDHTDGDSNASSLVHNKLSAASPKTVLEQGLRAGSRQATPPHAQSLANVQEPFPPTSSPAVHQPTASRSREASSSPHHEGVDTETYQEYDSSLDKLNNSLTELQGEIMRLSLQHEQMKASQSPVGFTPDSFDPRLSDALAAIGSPAAATDTSKTSRPIHGIPPQAPYVHGAMARHHRSASPASTPQQQLQQQQPQPSLPSGQPAPTQQQLLPPSTKQKVHESDVRLDSQSGSPAVVEAQTCVQQEKMDVNPDGGFFISFGGDSTPKRDKPKLSDHRRGVSPCRQDVADDVDSSEVAKIVAGQTISVLTPQKQDGSSEEAAPLGVGFVIQDEAARTKEQIAEDEMQKKKIKLMDMQKKRKEDQERKRMEKEAEIARKQEEKMQKEEDVERKKAEERARRDVIFQQYLQRKQQDEDDSTPPPPSQVKHRVEKRSSGGSSRPRPKSMMAKTKPMTPEPGALGGGQDSGSSSQEDLTGRGGPGSRASPSIMSTLRSSYHFRAPQTSRIRKAVSCNTLTHNGSAGPPATYRRPPSPDLCRIRQQRQRGNSQDSGSETGSGSNPGSDYAGPKLFVKPSAKSNRHIIANAISHCCLAGSVNTDMKNKVLEEMSKCEANHFLILFRDAGCQYRGLFIFSPETEEAFKAHGVGPKHITNQMCEKFYKYNSGAKSFTEITSTKHLSVSVDAVVLFSSLWKTGKAAVKR